MFEHGCHDGFWDWRAVEDGVRVHFGGKGPALDRQAALRRVLPEARDGAWLTQIHSSTVVEACPGDNGQGDALVSDRTSLGLSVVTADCVPVLLASKRQLAAVHAGWKGLARFILRGAIDHFDAPAERLSAWIGPAIGSCCYEVGQEVADQVVAASAPAIARPGPAGRPHLDLVAAARHQLTQAGLHAILAVGVCTRCSDKLLWSYRREGPGAGRNVAVIWRDESTSSRSTDGSRGGRVPEHEVGRRQH